MVQYTGACMCRYGRWYRHRSSACDSRSLQGDEWHPHCSSCQQTLHVSVRTLHSDLTLCAAVTSAFTSQNLTCTRCNCYRFEGRHRMRLAEEGLGYMRLATDTLIVIPNQNLFGVAKENTSLMQVQPFTLCNHIRW